LKRSEYIALGAIGLLVAATVWPRSSEAPSTPALTGNDGFQTLAFANLEECRASQIVTAAICETEFGKTAQTSIADAPKFNTAEACQGEFGANACRTATWNGASVFIPALAGVLIARSLTNSANMTSQPLFAARTGPAACPSGVNTTAFPQCAPRSGSSGTTFYSTGGGGLIGRANTSPTVVSRGSVPRTGSAFSGGTVTTQPLAANRSGMSTSSPSPSPTVSRGGFGSTGRSMSSGG
jgi:uncharacterized protein YgiB involved in biofilm formation